MVSVHRVSVYISAICRFASRLSIFRSLTLLRSSMERPARVSDRLLEILEFLEGEDALKLVGLKTVVSGF